MDISFFSLFHYSSSLFVPPAIAQLFVLPPSPLVPTRLFLSFFPACVFSTFTFFSVFGFISPFSLLAEIAILLVMMRFGSMETTHPLG
jgi:hypothetical protein